MSSLVNHSPPQSIMDSPNVNLHPESGYVLLMKVENNTVKKGQLLFRLEPETYLIALEKAEARRAGGGGPTPR